MPEEVQLALACSTAAAKAAALQTLCTQPMQQDSLACGPAAACAHAQEYLCVTMCVSFAIG